MTRVEEIKSQAVRLIADKGFEAMSLRQLAEAVGLRPGSLYTHYRSKAQLLSELFCDYLEDLLCVWGGRRGLWLSGPKERLLGFVAVYVGFYCARGAESRIVHLDFRSLDAQGKAAVELLKRQYEGELEAILRQGMRDGSFDLADLRMARLGILSLLQGLCAEGCASSVSGSTIFEACAVSILRLVGAHHRSLSKVNADDWCAELWAIGLDSVAVAVPVPVRKGGNAVPLAGYVGQSTR